MWIVGGPFIMVRSIRIWRGRPTASDRIGGQKGSAMGIPAGLIAIIANGHVFLTGDESLRTAAMLAPFAVSPFMAFIEWTGRPSFLVPPPHRRP